MQKCVHFQNIMHIFQTLNQTMQNVMEIVILFQRCIFCLWIRCYSFPILQAKWECIIVFSELRKNMYGRTYKHCRHRYSLVLVSFVVYRAQGSIQCVHTRKISSNGAKLYFWPIWTLNKWHNLIVESIHFSDTERLGKRIANENICIYESRWRQNETIYEHCMCTRDGFECSMFNVFLWLPIVLSPQFARVYRYVTKPNWIKWFALCLSWDKFLIFYWYQL